MSVWRQLVRGVRGLLHRDERDKDIDDEVQSYFEELTAAYRERGLSEDDARRAARRECGSLQAAKEQVRTYGWENTAKETFAADLRFAGRQLRRNPGFTTISILTLGLGIGTSTAIFSAINPILFKPLPYPHPGRILMIWKHLAGFPIRDILRHQPETFTAQPLLRIQCDL